MANETDDKKSSSGHPFFWGFLSGIAGTFVGGILLEAALRKRREQRDMLAGEWIEIETPDGFGDAWR